MSTYVIGDLQGCLEPLQRLLETCGFSRRADRLWFVGDMVNRGPDSLGVLRFIRDLGDQAVCVLGNHDLHLLVAAGGHSPLHSGDTFQDVLDAPDREPLLEWLRHRSLFHVEDGWAMVHAGLMPQWTVPRARELAAEAEALLRSDRCDGFLRTMYGNHPDRWDDALCGWDRARVIVNAMTRMRVCSDEGVMEFRHKGDPADIPAGYRPWFEVPGRRSTSHTLLFGHWSALGYRSGPGYVSLDSGCLWGRSLTALRLEDRRVFHVPCRAVGD